MTTDDLHLPELTRRQEAILALIIRTYTDTLEAVSSKYLTESSGLGVSSATVRNDMAELERIGYITAPHTSAGRVPTEAGYRYFVKHLLPPGASLSTSEQSHIAARLQTSSPNSELHMNTAATLMARAVGSAAWVTPPLAEINRFKHVELIAIQGRMALMVLVLHGGTVVQEMLNLAEVISQARLSETAARLNGLCDGLSANELRAKGSQLNLLERDILDLVAHHTEQTDQNPIPVYRDGLSDIIQAFPDSKGAQQAIRVFEERALLKALLSDLLNREDNTVQVVIAGENRWDELRHLTLVLSRYGIPGQVRGAVGVLGPTHINYSRAISTVRYVSDLMTDMVVTWYRAEGQAQGQSNETPQLPR